MKIRRLMLLGAFLSCVPVVLAGCSGSTLPTDTVEIKNDVTGKHYLKFVEDGSEVMRLLVLQGETYNDLMPYFPTLTEKPGFIRWWEGDYRYTDYSEDNQLKVWDDNNLVITINSYERRA